MAPSLAVHARRGAVALATAAVLSTAMAPAAFADASPSPAAPGLYGTEDPKFDGVFRQSLTFVAQSAVGVSPAKEAVDWLTGQQCADGGFPGFRADPAKACDTQKEFTDQTAAAVQGLAAAGGRSEQVTKGLDWLKAHQNDDGGWGYQPGSPSDANSTSIALGAFAATGQDPAKVAAKGGKDPVATLLTFQLGCDAKEGERGGFSFLKDDKSGLRADNLASAAAGLATRGKGFLVEPPKKGADQPLKPLDCAADDKAKPKDAAAAAEAVDGYLSEALAKNGGYLVPSMPGAPAKPDQGNTADAVVALAAGGHREAAEKPLTWLRSKESGTADWAKNHPGRVAKLILAAHATGADPRDFAGTDLVAQLNAMGPKPESASSAEQKDEEKKDDDKGVSVWWIVGVFFVASIGAGFLISGRKKKQL
ncbi:prenyltransferase/squalene oxidase repeat-containing protein [Streptomyces stramineus]